MHLAQVHLQVAMQMFEDQRAAAMLQGWGILPGESFDKTVQLTGLVQNFYEIVSTIVHDITRQDKGMKSI